MARMQAAFDVWVGMIGAILALKTAEDGKVDLPVTGGPYLLTSRDCPDQTAHNDFEVRKGRSQGFVVLVPGSNSICLLVYRASQSNVC